MKFKVAIGDAVLVLAIVLGWLKVVPFIVPFITIVVVGLFILTQLCWNCHAPYALPRLRGIWKNLGTCVVCGHKIEDKPPPN